MTSLHDAIIAAMDDAGCRAWRSVAGATRCSRLGHGDWDTDRDYCSVIAAAVERGWRGAVEACTQICDENDKIMSPSVAANFFPRPSETTERPTP